MRILVGIIVYNCDISLLVKCLLMFSRQTAFTVLNDFDLDIVILDNAEGAQIPEIKKAVRSTFPTEFSSKVEYVSSENIGFGGGHNRIFDHALERRDFNYYLCVNPDGIPHYSMIEQLAGFSQKNNNRGIYEARQFPVEHPKTYNPDTGQTSWCSGCCLMFPREVFDELGGFDDIFFMYMEDVDISWRAKISGYDCFTVQDALFSHFIGRKERDISFQNKHMLISGFKLATKFHNKSFANSCKHKMSKLATALEIKEIDRQLKERREAYREFKLMKFMDFKHNFSFSNVRW